MLAFHVISAFLTCMKGLPSYCGTVKTLVFLFLGKYILIIIPIVIYNDEGISTSSGTKLSYLTSKDSWALFRENIQNL